MFGAPHTGHGASSFNAAQSQRVGIRRGVRQLAERSASALCRLLRALERNPQASVEPPLRPERSGRCLMRGSRARSASSKCARIAQSFDQLDGAPNRRRARARRFVEGEERSRGPRFARKLSQALCPARRAR
jgi:hypothetical protein